MTTYRGDEFSGTISFDNYTLKPNDTVNIGVKLSTESAEYILFQSVKVEDSTSEVNFKFTSETTHNLVPSTYIFEIELIYAESNEHETVYQDELTVVGDVCR